MSCSASRSRPSWPRCEAKGKLLRELLEEINSPHIVEVRGEGLMVGVELDIEAAQVVNKGYDQGLILVNAGPQVLRLVPPLVITRGRDRAGRRQDRRRSWVRCRREQARMVCVVHC